jgi:hypothetical protein
LLAFAVPEHHREELVDAEGRFLIDLHNCIIDRHDTQHIRAQALMPRLIAAMLAPHLSGLFARQSDFGHAADAVLPTRSLRTFPKIWLVARIAARRAAAVPASSLT